jgi:ammonia channel protein AmtB
MEKSIFLFPKGSTKKKNSLNFLKQGFLTKLASISMWWFVFFALTMAQAEFSGGQEAGTGV